MHPEPETRRGVVGVLGGLGPEATLDFLARLIKRTPAGRDQDHLHLLIDHNPSVPDRNEAVAGTGPSPAPVLGEMARRLEDAGATFLVMPCNAAHAFASAIRAAVSIPLVDMIHETRADVKRRFPDAMTVGVLASTGCLDAELYQRAFEEVKIGTIVPTGHEREAFMGVLYRIKSGDASDDVQQEMHAIAMGLIARGAQVVVAGCTEVPLVLNASDVPCPIVSSTDVLVERTLDLALNRA